MEESLLAVAVQLELLEVVVGEEGERTPVLAVVTQLQVEVEAQRQQVAAAAVEAPAM